MAVHYRSKGFILEKKDLRETDQLFTVFTEEFGKINVLGRSIRKINSKLRAGIDLCYLSEIEFIQGKNYKTLTDAIVLQKFSDMTIWKMAGAMNVLIRGQEKDEKIWNLLNDVFCRWPESPEDGKFVYYCFLRNLLDAMGYKMELGAGEFYSEACSFGLSTILKKVIS